MRLYLVQHGESLSKEADASRGLSAKGRQDVQKVSQFLQRLGLSVKSVWHSGKARALQTAEIMVQAAKPDAVIIHREGLAPNDPVEPLISQLEEMTEDLIIVGHLPFMGKLASALVAGSEAADAVAFQQGGVICLERDTSSAWRVRWMVIPEILL